MIHAVQRQTVSRTSGAESPRGVAPTVVRADDVVARRHSHCASGGVVVLPDLHWVAVRYTREVVRVRANVVGVYRPVKVILVAVRVYDRHRERGIDGRVTSTRHRWRCRGWRRGRRAWRRWTGWRARWRWARRRRGRRGWRRGGWGVVPAWGRRRGAGRRGARRW